MQQPKQNIEINHFHLIHDTNVAIHPSEFDTKWHCPDNRYVVQFVAARCEWDDVLPWYYYHYYYHR